MHNKNSKKRETKNMAKMIPQKTSKKVAHKKTSKKLIKCVCCSKALKKSDRFLYVEEEVGRVFCSEECITQFFHPEIQKFEKEFKKIRQPNDLNEKEKENYAHLRWLTLQGPNEMWREKTQGGDFIYTLIAEFQPDHNRVWSICKCFMLRGEPSFLFVALLTAEPIVVDHYRKGESVEWHEMRTSHGHKIDSTHSKIPAPEIIPSDGLADDWTEDETIRAELILKRQDKDIAASEFGLYQSFLQETLENPDEVWSVKLKKGSRRNLYHFIRYYPDEKPLFWYLIVAKETEDEEQIEILDAFPTNDQSLVDRYRRDHQEVGVLDQAATTRVSRVVH